MSVCCVYCCCNHLSDYAKNNTPCCSCSLCSMHCLQCVFKVMLSISTVIDFHRSSQQLKRPQSRVNESAPHNVSQLNELWRAKKWLVTKRAHVQYAKRCECNSYLNCYLWHIFWSRFIRYRRMKTLVPEAKGSYWDREAAFSSVVLLSTCPVI